MTETLDTAPKKKKRRSGPSPTALTLEECRRRGWIAQTVEQTIPRTFIKRDFLGVIDIIAVAPPVVVGGLVVHPGGIIGIQATSGSNHASRVNKALEEPRLVAWLRAGGRFQVWSWSKCVGGWDLRDEEAFIKPKEGSDVE